MQNINALLVLFHHIADCLEAGKPQIKPKPKDKTSFFFFFFILYSCLICTVTNLSRRKHCHDDKTAHSFDVR